jgi:phospholipid/cholesterol/gamma-HCH transport system permease protein
VLVNYYTMSMEEARGTRALAGRAFLPTKSVLEEVGDMMLLTGKTIRSAVFPPYPYGGELVSQFLFALRLCWLPLLFSTVAINYGAAGLQAANILTLLGNLDRLGGFFVLAAIREVAPLITSVVLAGVAGTVKNLVVPRFLALVVVTSLFNVYAILFGLFGGILAEIVSGQPLGPFWDTLFANATVVDLWGSTLKTMMFGGIVAIVCCYKGMTASGGAEGVGRAVNQAVVTSLLGISAFNYVFMALLLATHPQIIVIK